MKKDSNKLTPRLQKIAENIKQGETMADIGTDHGFLPIALYRRGVSPRVVLTDISGGSLEKARLDGRELSEYDEFDLRLGDGLSVLKSGEVDVVVIAGMGGLLIADILQADLPRAHSFKKYILQPRTNVGRMRARLEDLGFSIEKEQLVEEGKFICEIITVVPMDKEIPNLTRMDGENSEVVFLAGPSQTAYESDYGVAARYDFPDSLIGYNEPLLSEYLNRNLLKQRAIINKIDKNGTAGNPSSKDMRKRAGARADRIELLMEGIDKK